MRKYKIVEEKRPTEDFTRWVPMVTNTLDPTGRIIDGDELQFKWKKIPTNNLFFFEEKAEELIDRYEMGQLIEGGKFIVSENEYKPKQR